MNKLGLFCLSFSILFTGCGGGGTVDVAPANQETPPVQDLSAIKATLNSIAESGVVDSGFFGIPESLEQAGKPKLAEEAKKMESLKSKKQIQAAAKKIADQL
ncbi:hypothetical protein [Gimesia aquarii]|uniref:Lipoprotein n=1 Tax=Gimesia aquarii TaxID=2527964 RepID=A0A517X385_9PLAN|nr:hypothetical protein [Gimesia aquarii]QDU11949.1 hypothetical protein V202x_53740 [Gimesia aquarii]